MDLGVLAVVGIVLSGVIVLLIAIDLGRRALGVVREIRAAVASGKAWRAERSHDGGGKPR